MGEEKVSAMKRWRGGERERGGREGERTTHLLSDLICPFIIPQRHRMVSYQPMHLGNITDGNCNVWMILTQVRFPCLMG
jgi:hypothetical protein